MAEQSEDNNGYVSHENGIELNLDVSPHQKGSSPTKSSSKPGDIEEVVVRQKEEKEKTKTVGILELFRFSDGLDRVLVFFGTLCAVINGGAIPAMIIVFSQMIDFFVGTAVLEEFLDSIPDYIEQQNRTRKYYLGDPSRLNCDDIKTYYGGTKTCVEDLLSDKIVEKMQEYAVYYAIIASIALVMGYLQVTCFMTSAERQAHRIRKACLYNILRQEIGWFDTHNSSDVNTRLGDDMAKIQDGIGDKVGAFFQWGISTLCCIVIAFVYGWKLTLVTLSALPALVATGVILIKVTASMTAKELEAYALAGGIAEEVFGAIRTVVAFGGQEKEAQRYKNNLSSAKAFGIKKGFINGACQGAVWFVIFSCYALGLWYGGKLFLEEGYSVADVLIVFFSVFVAATSMGHINPSIDAMSVARGAAYAIYELTDRKSAIDSFSEEGLKPDSVMGAIHFVDVHFNYPARPDVKVLSGLNIQAKPGQTVALVGASGSGKSTTVQLLMRFYDPLKGMVLIDGRNIKDLNVKWLRSHIGLVSQEPVLFSTTIAENIRYGRQDVTMQEIEKATQQANAYDFIMALPDKFETMVGESGSQLSGGQKQRLAIARALVRDPKILLLDEATSALDTESESLVQDALDKAREGRTTIVIAHRLSTIKTADIIIGFDDGKDVEMGSHEELMDKHGIYHQLVMNQQAVVTEEDKDIESMINKDKIQRTLSKTENKKQISTKEEEEKKEEDIPGSPFIRLMKYNGPEWYFILLGCLGSILNGGVWPSFAIVISRMLNVFSYSDRSKQEDEFQFYALLFVGIAVMSLFTYFIQGYFFSLSGEALTERLRDLTFRAMLKQNLTYFDDIKNSVGALTTRLATDAALMQGATGVRLGGALMGISNMGTALIIAFIYDWQMSLVILVFLPFIALSGFMEIKLLAGQVGKNKEALEAAGKVTVESVGNIRTVASLTMETKMISVYMGNLEIPHKTTLKKAYVVGLAYSCAQSILYYAFAASFVFGAYKIENGEMSFKDVYLVFAAIVFGALGLGNATAFAPNVGKATTSAKRIFQIIDSQPSIDYTNPNGETLNADYKAEVTFSDVEFCYPNRLAVKVLQGLTFSVSPGETVALVGSSGCGKSTSVQLIERFYDIISGEVNVGNQNVKNLNITWLRRQIGIVSQEPTLFGTSIAENIAYGDNTRAVTMDEIISAARGANIHDFIAALPDGYNTNVGSKGTQLSGGQKQRIAIARALVRNPKILLLDEATSALDTESEKIVQEALDKARNGRTCIVIAHRLSTVQTADKICVISHGKVAESGTHSQLMAKQGFYFKLVKSSQRESK